MFWFKLIFLILLKSNKKKLFQFSKINITESSIVIIDSQTKCNIRYRYTPITKIMYVELNLSFPLLFLVTTYIWTGLLGHPVCKCKADFF